MFGPILRTANELGSSAFHQLVNRLYVRNVDIDLTDGNPTIYTRIQKTGSPSGDGPPLGNLSIVHGDSNRPYYTGLHGVNLELDKQVVRFLWLSIFLLVGIVFVVRIGQLFQAYIRRIYCMTCKPSHQRYYTIDHNSAWPWLKRHLVYAPLGKKRHNREFQLSSAVNYGTIPSRIHAVLLAVYLISNIVYLLIIDYKNPEKGAIMAELRGRSGILATANMVPLVVLAGRNNIAIPILRVSFDTFNLFHRWIGRLVAFESAVHFFAWMTAYIMAKGPDASVKVFNNNGFLQYGLVGLIGILLLPLHSFSVLRHAFYETFLHLHQSLAFLSILGVYVHLDSKKLPAFPFILAVVLLWIVERLVRIARIVYLNYSHQGGFTSATVEALPGQACRVTFQLPRHITVRPGSHVYVYFPTISFWMSHPFSIAWTNIESEPAVGSLDERMHADPPVLGGTKTPNSLERQGPNLALSRAPTSLSVVMVARTGMTRDLYTAASTSPEKRMILRGVVEGPYAGHDSLLSYGTVIMFAGGAGITHHLVQIRHLLSGARAETVATRKIVLVWSIKSTEAMEWVKAWMSEIMHMEGRRKILRIVIHVTKPRERENFRHAKETIRVVKGRVDPSAVLDEFLPNRIGATMVSVCGPGSLADDVRMAVRKRLHLGYVDMNEESFSW